jgi:hypothetical protein
MSHAPIARVFLYLALIGALASGIVGVGVVVAHVPVRLSVMMGLFFACFSVAKFALVWESLRARPQAGAPTERAQSLGSPGLFRFWLIYKIIAGVVAAIAAVYLLTAGAAVVDGFVAK